MATIHVTMTEAEADFKGLMERVRQGDEIMIDEDRTTIARVAPAGEPYLRLLSESLRLAEEHNSDATLDGEFEKDLLAVIESHREPLIDPDNDPWA